jgi:hypothetical protein
MLQRLPSARGPVAAALFTALFAALLAAPGAFAQAPRITVQQIGASFVEPPPGRDKSLAGFTMEKVDTTLVVGFADRIVADLPVFSRESNVAVTALLANGGRFDLGRASIGARRVSDDMHKVSLTLAVDRLPDQPVKGLRFTGTTRIGVAAGIKRPQVEFKPQPGAKLDAGAGGFTVSQVEASALTLTGGDALSRLAGLKLIKADGSAATAERGSFSRMGTDITSQWRFSSGLSAGRLELSYYDKLEDIDVPIDLVVAKPY